MYRIATFTLMILFSITACQNPFGGKEKQKKSSEHDGTYNITTIGGFFVMKQVWPRHVSTFSAEGTIEKKKNIVVINCDYSINGCEIINHMYTNCSTVRGTINEILFYPDSKLKIDYAYSWELEKNVLTVRYETEELYITAVLSADTEEQR